MAPRQLGQDKTDAAFANHGGVAYKMFTNLISWRILSVKNLDSSLLLLGLNPTEDLCWGPEGISCQSLGLAL